MHFCNVIVYVLMYFLGRDPKYVYFCIALVAFSGLFQGGPYSEVTTLELRARTKDNKSTFLAITTCKIVFQAFTVFVMISIGYLIQYSILFFYLDFKSFFFILIANTFMTFSVHWYRTNKYGDILH